ncbi:MAG: sigma 54-interacting transcriptional regulator [Deltaproteobacteria bacterium]|jgi:transcriptional regulator with PAS, ATPase and Fis domain|nr:sigma 54-interacting transcriptional regulator [Deltaproteobacteria bacterium]
MGQPPIESLFSGRFKHLDLPTALEGLPLGVILIDQDGLITDANDHMSKFLGHSLNYLIGKTIFEFFPKSASKLLSLSRSGGEAHYVSLPEIPGTYLVTLPLTGDFKGLSIAVVDFRVLVNFGGPNQQRAYLNSIYEKVSEDSKIGLLLTDSEGTIIRINSAASEQLGANRIELEGHSVRYLHENKICDGTVVENAVFTKSISTHLSRNFRTKTTSLITAIPFFNIKEDISLILVTFRNLSSQLESETALFQERAILCSIKEEMSLHYLPEVHFTKFANKSPLMLKTLKNASNFAFSSLNNILILGEHGSGKQSIAHYIHNTSAHSDEPFTRIACSTVPDTLLESTIFGTEYMEQNNGLEALKAGLLESIGRGSLYFKEIGDLSLQLQQKLLQLLRTRQFFRLGGKALLQTQANLIFSSSKDLKELCNRKLFLPELLDIFSETTINVPALRNRPEDIVDIAWAELVKLNRRFGCAKFLDHLALQVLLNQPYPGNVRELNNAIYQAVIFSSTPEIGPFLQIYFNCHSLSDLRNNPEPSPQAEIPPSPLIPKSFPETQGKNLSLFLEQIEKKLLLDAASKCNNTREIALFLGISQASVSRKLRKHRILPPGMLARKG